MGEALPNLLKQTRRAILEVSGDGAYNARASHAAIKIKGAIALIPPREGAAFWKRGLPWFVRSYTAQISIGKSGMDTTNVHSQKQRCIELNGC